jgi:hypothetical protein
LRTASAMASLLGLTKRQRDEVEGETAPHEKRACLEVLASTLYDELSSGFEMVDLSSNEFRGLSFQGSPGLPSNLDANRCRHRHRLSTIDSFEHPECTLQRSIHWSHDHTDTAATPADSRNFDGNRAQQSH